MSKRIGVKKKILDSWIYPVVSISAGVVAWLFGELLFEGLTEKLFTPLGILLYFLFVFVILFVALTALLIKKLNSEMIKHKVRVSWLLFLVVLLVFLLATGLFEFLYELGEEEIPEPTSLIFLIDDSGSMEGNEPDRIKAINDVMKDSNLPFAVYSFTGGAKRLRDMGTYRSELSEHDLVFYSNGGTEIIRSIKDVLQDLENGNIKNAGISPKILLVSDGASSSFGLRSMAKSCRKQMISVSSIGMQGSSEELLKRIAESTGGVYVSCTDVSSLGEDLTKAVATDIDRNLLSERVVYRNDGLYAVLRILFLSIMGLLWSLLKMTLISEEKKYKNKAMITSAVLCVVGALLMELGTAIGISVVLLRLIFDVLWTFTLGKLPSKATIIETNGNSVPSPVFPDGTLNVKQIAGETKSTEGVKQIHLTKQPTEGGKNSGVFGANNNSGGMFVNDRNVRTNIDGVFGSGNGSTNSDSGLFGKKDGGSGLFGN